MPARHFASALAGRYPALRLRPPWWFFDSIGGMTRYRDLVHETAGLYNTAGFNDDTRAFPSIPARHDVWRRVECNWLAGMVLRGVIDHDDANEMAVESAYRLAKTTYRLSREDGGFVAPGGGGGIAGLRTFSM